MFAGILLNSFICPLPKQNVLLAVYYNKLYTFSLQQTHLLNDIELSDNLILHFAYQQATNSVIALDNNGFIITAVFNPDMLKCSNLKKHKVCKQISDGRIVLSQFSNQFNVFYLTGNNNSLNQYHHKTGAKNIISKDIYKIIYSNKGHLVCANSQQATQISIFDVSTETSKYLKSYKHICAISSVQISDKTLFIGDQKGKIHILKGFLSNNYQNIKTLYEWHLHQVLSLFSVGQYLYSAGEEGTVVMWHLRQNKRDFLPRIGTQINELLIQTGTVYTLLNDNRISSIDLSNDKKVRNYTTIINPLGFITKQMHEDKLKGSNKYENKAFVFQPMCKTNKIIISALPGSLQILDLATGINSKLQIIDRNLVGRLDDQYPEPHQIIQAKLSKNGDILACSVIGVNCNMLRFYKYQNFQFTLISKVQNPHKGKQFNIVSYKSMFITYSDSDSIIRFWSLQSYKKKSIIEKQEQIIGCCGQLSFRQKNPVFVTSCQENDLIGVTYQNQIALISLKDKKIQVVFKTKQQVNQIELIRSSNKTFLVVMSNTKIVQHQFNNGQLINSKKIVEFESTPQEVVFIRNHANTKNKKNPIAILIKLNEQTQKVIQYDLQSSKILNQLLNESSDAKLNNICFINNKLFAISSKIGLYNLTDQTSPVSYKQKSEINFKFDVQETQYEQQSLNSLHQHYVARHDHKIKSQIIEIDEKIEVDMYPSLEVGFKILMQKMFY